MSPAPRKATADIQRLLNERTQIEQWLVKLDEADETPRSVRDRVRSDYERRLESVVDELQGFRDELEASLVSQRSTRDDLLDRKDEVSEQLAESSLRHDVGEYDAEKWSEISRDFKTQLERISRKLGDTQDEIDRLEEVLALVDQRPAPPPAEDQEPPARPDMGVDEGITSSQAESVEPEAARSGAEEQADAFDELQFLKSLGDERRGSPKTAASAPKDAAPAPKADPGTVGAEGVAPLTAPSGQPSRGTAKRSLKCGDCGALNLPTEWYCERCGAELASL